ncbi:unnamed protein product [Paramecium pentaurelia]|uniref:Uncharacterized protein n=1 Tax=Paramecium pentaurelia TaxID=43138 RepID=A0A8S1XG77_9CILI|nr:unnamed protein product [Paramecium pentaurelia]
MNYLGGGFHRKFKYQQPINKSWIFEPQFQLLEDKVQIGLILKNMKPMKERDQTQFKLMALTIQNSLREGHQLVKLYSTSLQERDQKLGVKLLCPVLSSSLIIILECILPMILQFLYQFVICSSSQITLVKLR